MLSGDEIGELVRFWFKFGCFIGALALLAALVIGFLLGTAS